MRISVAMCTYNGAQYLPEQLASIAAQTRPPDELVICDDCSSDKTRNILETFKAEASFSVRLYFNEQNLGSTKNFEKAIKLCEGEIIAACDQDDVWHPEKLRFTIEVFIATPKAGHVFTDMKIVDENLCPLGYRAWQSGQVDFGRKEQQLFRRGKALNLLITRNVVTGATMAFRADLRRILVPFPENYPAFVHDYWIALIISTIADLIPINEPLVTYRTHDRQQLSLIPPSVSSTKRREVARRRETYSIKQELLELVIERLRTLSTKDKQAKIWLSHIQERRRHYQVRNAIPQLTLAQRLPLVTAELLTAHYHLYSAPDTNPWREVAKDLLPHKLRSLGLKVINAFKSQSLIQRQCLQHCPESKENDELIK